MTKHVFTSVAFAAIAASQMGATNCGQVTRDPGFDLWCGDQLCAWKVERGSAVRVPTWNEGDPGVQLVGSDAAIEQLAPVNSGDDHSSCIEFTMIANIDLQAQVTLNIDVDGDGTIDRSEPLPTSAWKPLSFLLAVRAPYSGIRFELAKTGDGTAILAEIQAKTSDLCDASLPAIDPRPAPLGSPCDGSGDCASGFCEHTILPGPATGANGTCAGCDATSCAGSGSGSGSGPKDVCGAGVAIGTVDAVPLACVAAASKLLGELCDIDAECATGICQIGACSTCRDPDHACSGGATCGPAWDTGFGVYAPWVCAPHGHARTTGEPCGADDDCASGACTGTAYSECSDGRPCTTANDCPADSTLLNGDCSPVGTADGTCN